MKKTQQFNLWYWIVAILGVFAVQYAVGTARTIAAIPYSQFEQLLRDGKVADIGISDRFIQGTLKEPLEVGQNRFAATRVAPDAPFSKLSTSDTLLSFGTRPSIRGTCPGSLMFG